MATVTLRGSNHESAYLEQIIAFLLEQTEKMMTTKNRAFVLVSIALLSACSTNSVESLRPLSPETDWVANSSEWVFEAESVYAKATEFVREQAAVRPKDSWVVILDIDETVLNNVAYQVGLDRAGEDYSNESWYLWTQRQEASLVPGAAEFIEAVRESGGLVGFVTNRRDIEQLATEINLAQLGIHRGEDFQFLLTRADKNGVGDKQARFGVVASLLKVQGYGDVETIAYVGDSIGDKSAATDTAFFCIDQGAMYGDPCAARPGPDR
ncbi:hypothetical protein D1227_06730 [Henriciella mobilis]|uniref:HAD family acid phosphatase n=1 Tax=Henriciella mobilis TaxID=2305467 RepID=UPI000EEF8E86|nr:HAD family acid phosphatase [Henriciella mobilis]RIJ22828.1 hypothetical protein D1227_06730 [Henriciella mobilis]